MVVLPRSPPRMQAYFFRRLLLIPPTLFGITILVFAITRFAPGGPMERALMEMQQMNVAGGSSQDGMQQALSEEQKQQLAEYYGFDKPWYTAYFHWLDRLVRGDLGDSFRFGEPVTQVIWERLPVSTYFGVVTLLVTYTVCIPLGILKAMKHNTWVDNTTSVGIFVGYAIPGYALGALLVVFFASRWELFPIGGFTHVDFEDFTLWEKLKDLLHHTALPLACYLVHAFAFVTMLMKNHLMDNLSADYIRTALAKGISYHEAVRRHALRNSMIPIATNLGHQVMLFVAGSFLIEKIFNIDGFGLLGFNSVIDRDYPVVMGVLLLSASLMLLGNILSDILVALVDPRVRFK